LSKPKNIFQFKQFDVDQLGSAMKINTDGVLLGAIAENSLPENILDIGTGTGVIALMLAQRFPNAYIDAVEIDELAAQSAQANARNSIFRARINVFNSDFQAFEVSKKYDLIVSNPPFFVNDLKSEEVRKGIARHADEDFFNMLVSKSADLLTDQGKLWLVLPVKQADEVIKLSNFKGLTLSKRIHIHSDQTKATFRQIICLTKNKDQLQEHDFYIYEAYKEHTLAYKVLLKDFFLAF
jgi:tRNA1Val (adenine37-N6)-methyltransferase